MIPRTVQSAAAVKSTFTTNQYNDYGNIILNGYLSTASNISVAGTVGSIDTVTFTGGSGYTNGTYPGTIFLQGCAPGCVHYQVTICFDHGLPGQVNTLELEAETGICRFQGHVYHDACVQARTRNTDFLGQGMLPVRVKVIVHKPAKITNVGIRDTNFRFPECLYYCMTDC
jgi:hypothetical protein